MKLSNSQYEAAAHDYCKRLCRAGNPFPLIAFQWPDMLVTDPHEARFFQGEIGSIENPCLRLDDWQRDIEQSYFDDGIAEIAAKGCTRSGKGASNAIAACLWIDVWNECRVILTSYSFQHATDVIYGEIVKWLEQMQRPPVSRPGKSGFSLSSTRYCTVANPQTGEGFSGQHGPRTLFILDECCHDDQTEVLTDVGWKLFGDLNGNERLLSMDPETCIAFYVKSESIHASYRTGDMMLYQCRGVDFCVTPDHKMLHRTKRRGGYSPPKLTKCEEMTKAPHIIPRTFIWEAQEVEFHTIPQLDGPRKSWPRMQISMSEWLEFLGWYLSEGGIEFVNDVAYSVKVTQVKDRSVLERLMSLASSWGLTCRLHDCVLKINSRQIAEHLLQHGRAQSDRTIPRYVSQCSKRQINIFLDAYASGDGYKIPGRKPSHTDRRLIYTSSQKMSSELHELCLKAGFGSTVCKRLLKSARPSINGREIAAKHDGYCISMAGRTDIAFRPKIVKRIRYSGMVYCAHLPPHHVMLTRRNGKCLWSGNTSVPEGRIDDARKQARKIVAIANPRTLSGSFHAMYPKVDPDVTQTIRTPVGARRCFTIDAATCMNPRNKRLERPIGPPGGIEIQSVMYAEGDPIPPEHYEIVKPLIPNQVDYARYLGIISHPDQNHVRVFGHGKFPIEDPELQLILPSWLDRHRAAWHPAIVVDCFAFDVAASEGGDESSLTALGQEGVAEVITWQFSDIMQSVGFILEKAATRFGVNLTKGRNPIAVDCDGLGKGAGDRLAELGCWVKQIHNGARAEVNPQRYANFRAEMYGILAERLDPRGLWGGQTFALPDDPMLIEELTAPEKIYGSDPFRFSITPKRKPPGGILHGKEVVTLYDKLGRSPDRGDGVAMGFVVLRELHAMNEWYQAQQGGGMTTWPRDPETANQPQEKDLKTWLRKRYGSAAP